MMQEECQRYAGGTSGEVHYVKIQLPQGLVASFEKRTHGRVHLEHSAGSKT